MACECCCKHILKLCKVSVCNDSLIDFGILATVAGVHKMKFDFLGVEYTVEKSFVLEERIKFPTEDLNESHVFQMKLYDPEGTQILISKDGIEYDCFEVQTVLSYAVNP